HRDRSWKRAFHWFFSRRENRVRHCARHSAAHCFRSSARSFSMLAQASINVPSTEKCSLDKSLRTSGRFKTPVRNLAATSPPKRRSRFLQKTVASHTGSSAERPTNQRNRRLAHGRPPQHGE